MLNNYFEIGKLDRFCEGELMEEFAKQMDDANHNSVTQDREKKVTQI